MIFRLLTCPRESRNFFVFLKQKHYVATQHYRQLYVDRPDPIAFMPVAVDNSGRIYDDFLRLLFLHDHRKIIGFI